MQIIPFLKLCVLTSIHRPDVCEFQVFVPILHKDVTYEIIFELVGVDAGCQRPNWWYSSLLLFHPFCNKHLFRMPIQIIQPSIFELFKDICCINLHVLNILWNIQLLLGIFFIIYSDVFSSQFVFCGTTVIRVFLSWRIGWRIRRTDQ